MSVRIIISVGLLFLSGCVTVAGILHHKNIKQYHAVYQEPCGRSILVLKPLAGEEVKEIAVQPKGKNPIFELHDYVLINTVLTVSGYFTGKTIDDHHCGAYPQFFITGYEAAGPVSRCTTAGDWAMLETVKIFDESLPPNRLSAGDFINGAPQALDVSLSQCRETAEKSCKSGERTANSCDRQSFWCCRLPGSSAR